MRASIVVLLLASMLVAGCGYFRAGEWENDSGNWRRAFGEARPADGIVIVH